MDQNDFIPLRRTGNNATMLQVRENISWISLLSFTAGSLGRTTLFGSLGGLLKGDMQDGTREEQYGS